MSYVDFAIESIYVAYILEDNEIVIQLEDDVEDAKNTWLVDGKKVIGYMMVNGYEDADEDDIRAAFKYGYHDIKEYFEDLKDYVDYIKDPYTYNGVSRSDFF